MKVEALKLPSKEIILPGTKQVFTRSQIASWTPEHQEDFLTNAWMELGDTWDIKTRPVFPIVMKPQEVVDSFMELCLNPDYLHFPIKHILNMNLFPYQLSVVRIFWTKLLPIFLGARGASKTTLLATYLTLRAVIDQGVQIVIAGGGLRQAGLVFGAMQRIYFNAPVLRDICGHSDVNEPKRTNFGYEWKVGKSLVTAIPIGSSGDKIRGLRANVVAVDEFSVVNPEIFETVIRGFASVASKDTFETVKQAYQDIILEDMGIEMAEEDSVKMSGLKGNQIILSGTATYQFNHFYKYYKKYCDIIYSKGKGLPNPEEYKNFAVIRIPYNHLPVGLIDKTILSQGTALMDSTTFKNEYGCIFSKDSDGFFPATSVYGSTCPIKYADQLIDFFAELVGEKNAQYIAGIDPASEADNLAISIGKLCNGYVAHVYTWKVNRRLFEEDKEKFPNFYKGIHDYNSFVIYKIHDLMRRFNIVRMHIDAGGGGNSLVEGLKDPTKVPEGGSCLYDIDDPNVTGLKGMQIIKLCQFRNTEWYENAHYNLLKDLTARKYIFPYYDQLAIAKEVEVGKSVESVIMESIENVYANIEEGKYQTILIQEKQTAKGSKSWDLPKVKGVMTEDIKTKLKKDHFTSILLTCDAGRDYNKEEDAEMHTTGGTTVGKTKKNKEAAGQRYYFGGEKNAILRNKGYNYPETPVKRVVRH